MLTIVADYKHQKWLRYILEEFKRINIANFKIRVSGEQVIGIGSNNVIHYSNIKSPFPHSIPSMADVPIRNEVEWLRKDLFILSGTRTEIWKGLCDYDILWNAFVFLSRLEEYLHYRSHDKIKSYSLRHPRTDKKTFDIPIVNILFDEFENLIKYHFPSLEFGNKKKAMIELSHDVDYIEKTVQLRIKRTVFNIFSLLKVIDKPKIFIRRLSHTILFLIMSSSYWCFDYWKALEKKYSIRSVFYLYVKTNQKKFISWLLDPSYNLATNQRLQAQIIDLLAEGFEIGLHGSWHSALSERQMKIEKKTIEEIIGKPVTKIRQHWLRIDEKLTPNIHEKYFKYDSTLGWNDRIGFRSGCVSRHRHYNHTEQRPYNYMITPQVVMDAVIFDCGLRNTEKQIKKMYGLIRYIEKYKTSHISISWHQRVCSKDYNWHLTYEKLLEEMSKDCE